MVATHSTSTRSLIDAARRHRGDRAAIIAGDLVLGRDDLWQRVDARRDELDLPPRSLVVLTGANTVEFVITYLALLDGGHVPVLAASPTHARALVECWQPTAAITTDSDADDGVCGRGAGDTAGTVERFERPDGRPGLHRDLGLLLSTSGSTGDPKLVRLSHRNLVANAESIADSLGLDESDVGITSLPLHYCYGLSVLHSHLLVGAPVVVTDGSVVDPCFVAAMRRHGVTSLAGVPHTFELIERAGADRLDLPSLRLVTQAGGRLAPASVTRWLDRAERWGADFVVMYGQTEATARMAYLPPELARRNPRAIGVAIPGGELRVEPIDGRTDAGELVYRGDNVMMGYAQQRGDLERGTDLDELRTGDLARYDADLGVFEIVGRRSRFVKPFGLRVDLDRLEQRLSGLAPEVVAAGDDERITVLAPGGDAAAVAAAACAATTLPASRLDIVVEGHVPRTDAGKIDYVAVAALGAAEPMDAAHAEGAAAGDADDATDHVADDRMTPGESVAATFATVLGVDTVDPRRTFVELGGDSLSYVECSIRLERSMDRVPSDWHLRPVAELAAIADESVGGAPTRRTWFARVDTTVLLRAIGICLIVSTHMRLRHLPGGAHLMLAVVGYNVARFLLPATRPLDRLRSGARTLGRVAVPTIIWTAVGMVVFGSYSVGTLLLVNNYVGPRSHADDHWHFWFIEVFVHLVLVATLLLSVPGVGRVERRFPYGFALGLLVATYLLQMEWAYLDDWYNLRFRTHGVAFFFALGWLVYRSRSVWQRAATTALCIAAVAGFFRMPLREAIIVGGLVALLWLPSVWLPRPVVGLAGVIARASLWIYLSHFTFWPLLDDTAGLLRPYAYVATIAVGVLVAVAADRVEGAGRRVVALGRRRASGARRARTMHDAARSGDRALVGP